MNSNPNYDIELYYEMLVDAFENQEQNTDFAKAFYDALKSGNKTLYQKQKTERKKFDDTWITTIESYFPNINRITRNMRSHLKYEEEIIPIEKVKRVTNESIKHLSSHTQYLKESNENEDEVIPEKILSDLSEIEYGIYENRFIMTLIYRLESYVYERIKEIKEHLYAKRKIHFYTDNTLNFSSRKYQVKIDITQEESIRQRKEDLHNENVLRRAERLHKLITMLFNSGFMKEMKKYKRVTPPIIKTQIILKNPDFKAGYFLWLYLDQHYELGYDYEVEEINKRFTPVYKQNIERLLMASISTILAHNKIDIKTEDIDKRSYKELPTKIIYDLPGEIILDDNPNLKIENVSLNEYFMVQYKKMFGQKIPKPVEINKEFKVSLYEAMEESLKIHNGVFESLLKYNADEDVFSKLVLDKDPVKTLEKAYQKHKIASIVREIKEKDFRRILELEHKWEDEIRARQQELIKLEQQLSDDRIQKILADESKILEKKTKTQLEKERRKYLSQFRLEKQKLIRYKKQLEKELKEKLKKLKESEKKKLTKEKEKLIKLQQKELEKELNKLNKLQQKEIKEIIKEKDKLNQIKEKISTGQNKF